MKFTALALLQLDAARVLITGNLQVFGNIAWSRSGKLLN
jgi:hypothetical protein